MDISLERILSLKSSMGITDTQFQKDLGLYATALSEWKNGKTKSYIKHLPKIAKYFNVSVDYILGNTDEKEKPADSKADELSEYDARVLAWFHSLPQEKRKAILDLGDGPQE